MLRPRQIGCVHVLAVIVAGNLLLFGCQSAERKAQPPTAAKAEAPDKKGAAVEREQMQVDLRVEGATAEKGPDSTITLDYPVTKEKNDIIPDWVINPGIGDILGAVGVAAKGKLGTKEQLNEARLNARLEIAFMLELRLQNVGRTQLEQQVQAVGAGLQDNSRKSILNVDRNIADIVLAGSRQRALWFDPENEECFVWMVLDGDVLKKVDHSIQKEVSVFIANTPITTEYIPERRKPQAPTVVLEVPSEPEPPKEPIEKLEQKLKAIETIPLQTDGNKTKEQQP